MDPSELETLFRTAKAGNWTVGQWIAASASRANASEWRRLLTWAAEETSGVFQFNKEGDGIYITSSEGRWAAARRFVLHVLFRHPFGARLRVDVLHSTLNQQLTAKSARQRTPAPPPHTDRDTTEIQLISTAPGAKVLQRIASNPLVNVGGLVLDQDDWTPQMVTNDYLKPERKVLDPSIAADWGRLEGFIPGGIPSLRDISADKKTWVVVYSRESLEEGSCSDIN
jgi:hypothetical protein